MVGLLFIPEKPEELEEDPKLTRIEERADRPMFRSEWLKDDEDGVEKDPTPN